MRYTKAAAMVAGSLLAVGVGASPAAAGDGTPVLEDALAHDGPVCGTLGSVEAPTDQTHLDLGENQPSYEAGAGGVLQEACGSAGTVNPFADQARAAGGTPMLGGLPLG
ncbi:hypothetical protein [Streptomyces sparsus]